MLTVRSTKIYYTSQEIETGELQLIFHSALQTLFILKGSFLRQADYEIFSWKDKLVLSFKQVDDDDDDKSNIHK